MNLDDLLFFFALDNQFIRVQFGKLKGQYIFLVTIFSYRFLRELITQRVIDLIEMLIWPYGGIPSHYSSRFSMSVRASQNKGCFYPFTIYLCWSHVFIFTQSRHPSPTLRRCICLCVTVSGTIDSRINFESELFGLNKRYVCGPSLKHLLLYAKLKDYLEFGLMNVNQHSSKHIHNH